MKKLLIIFIASLLTACGGENNSTTYKVTKSEDVIRGGEILTKIDRDLGYIEKITTSPTAGQVTVENGGINYLSFSDSEVNTDKIEIVTKKDNLRYNITINYNIIDDSVDHDVTIDNPNIKHQEIKIIGKSLEVFNIIDIVGDWNNTWSVQLINESQNILTFLNDDKEIVFNNEVGYFNNNGITSETILLVIKRGGDEDLIINFTVKLIPKHLDGLLVAENQNITFIENRSHTLTFRYIDTAEMDQVYMISVSQNPNHGTISKIDPEGRFIYTPNISYQGVDSFKIKISDSSGRSSVATFNVVIPERVGSIRVNDTKNFNRTSDRLEEFSGVFTVVNDGNIGWSNPVFEVEEQPLGGGVVVVDRHNGSFKYTPNPEFAGVDQFVVRVFDASGREEFATYSVHIDYYIGDLLVDNMVERCVDIEGFISCSLEPKTISVEYGKGMVDSVNWESTGNNPNVKVKCHAGRLIDEVSISFGDNCEYTVTANKRRSGLIDIPITIEDNFGRSVNTSVTVEVVPTESSLKVKTDQPIRLTPGVISKINIDDLFEVDDIVDNFYFRVKNKEFDSSSTKSGTYLSGTVASIKDGKTIDIITNQFGSNGHGKLHLNLSWPKDGVNPAFGLTEKEVIIDLKIIDNNIIVDNSFSEADLLNINARQGFKAFNNIDDAIIEYSKFGTTTLMHICGGDYYAEMVTLMGQNIISGSDGSNGIGLGDIGNLSSNWGFDRVESLNYLCRNQSKTNLEIASPIEIVSGGAIVRDLSLIAGNTIKIIHKHIFSDHTKDSINRGAIKIKNIELIIDNSRADVSLLNYVSGVPYVIDNISVTDPSAASPTDKNLRTLIYIRAGSNHENFTIRNIGWDSGINGSSPMLLDHHSAYTEVTGRINSKLTIEGVETVGQIFDKNTSTAGELFNMSIFVSNSTISADGEGFNDDIMRVTANNGNYTLDIMDSAITMGGSKGAALRFSSIGSDVNLNLRLHENVIESPRVVMADVTGELSLDIMGNELKIGNDHLDISANKINNLNINGNLYVIGGIDGDETTVLNIDSEIIAEQVSLSDNYFVNLNHSDHSIPTLRISLGNKFGLTQSKYLRFYMNNNIFSSDLMGFRLNDGGISDGRTVLTMNNNENFEFRNVLRFDITGASSSLCFEGENNEFGRIYLNGTENNNVRYRGVNTEEFMSKQNRMRGLIPQSATSTLVLNKFRENETELSGGCSWSL